ncbi:MAG: glycoside hydrolase family 32 protein [Chitinophagaceae bacterium]|nr:glycoside hydrolase family 32 protein [Chitinophagaceae bacterium]
MRKYLLIAFLLIFLNSFSQNDTYSELYRPRFHFSPPANWINDPNGLVYYKGQYHMFYQHNPFGNVWGHMTWGHAVSNDLAHWKHLPIAIPEENGIMIFSGTCVADINNTSGLGKNGQVPLIAIYTGHISGPVQSQAQYLAYSLDDGITWTKYAGNPILDLKKKDFRDPKVFWYEPRKYWVMCLMLPEEHIVQFYSSKNLVDWKHLSNFGPAGDTSGVWECPDLTPVPIDGKGGKKKWLLQMSMNASMQYFVGEFNGVSFTSENKSSAIARPDYGPDYYAAIAWGQLPNQHQPAAIGWINNWYYANDIPTTPWKGAMSLPRTLSVKKKADEWVLQQQPYLSGGLERKMIYKDFKIGFSEVMRLPVTTQQCEIDVSLTPVENGQTGIRIAAGNGKHLEIGYDDKNQVLYLDRSKTANQAFNKEFEKRSRFEIPYQPKGRLRLRIFFDHSIAEVFVNDGERVFTAQLFPDETDNGIELFNTGGPGSVGYCFVYDIKTIW